MAERLNLDGLRYAQAVAITLSFSAAARSCGVSQPALSNSIAKLEERLGDKLFDRSTRGVKPTAFGLLILPMIDRALGELHAVSAEARRWTGAAQQSVHVGISPLIDPGLVAMLFAAVRELPHPREIVLREANMRELREELLGGSVDLILVPAVHGLQAFERRRIHAEPVAMVLGDDSSSDPMELADAVDTTLILVPDACGLTTFTKQLFRDRELPLHPYPGEAASYLVLEQWARLGLGAAILPRSKLSSPEAPHRLLCDSGQPVEIVFEAVWRTGSTLAADVAVLADLVAESAISMRQT
jgi:DNA-binding transcriptional LysR family regulator